MVSRADVTAVVVTRGDVDLAPILEPLDDLDRVVYDNGTGTVAVLPPGYLPEPIERIWHQPDLSVYGRYAALAYVKTRIVLVQDDDCVLSPESIAALVALWQPGYAVVNMPERFRAHYSDTALVGFGAIFERELPARAFEKIGLGPDCSPFPEDTDWTNFRVRRGGAEWSIPDAATFHRECDTVFTGLTPRILADVPYTDLPHATGPDRLYRQDGHVGQRQRMIKLVRQVRDA